MYASLYFLGSQMIATTLSTQENRASALGKYIILFSFVQCFCCRQQTYSGKKQNWFYFERVQLTSPKQSRKNNKKKMNFFSTYYRFDSAN